MSLLETVINFNKKGRASAGRQALFAPCYEKETLGSAQK